MVAILKPAASCAGGGSGCAGAAACHTSESNVARAPSNAARDAAAADGEGFWPSGDCFEVICAGSIDTEYHYILRKLFFLHSGRKNNLFSFYFFGLFQNSKHRRAERFEK